MGERYEQGVAGMVESLFILAAFVTVAVLGVFVVGRRYLENGMAFSPVEIEWLREEAEGRISALSPRVMELAEQERALARSMELDEVDDESRSGAEELLVEAAADDFWGRFVRASALVEDEPDKAFEELDRLPGLLEETISKLEKAEGLCTRRRVG